MKKTMALLLGAVLLIGALGGCGNAGGNDGKTIVVGASTTPHAEILKVAAEIMQQKGYTLTVKEFDDYVLPNVALQNGEIDANYFQHKPHMDDFNQEQKASLVSVAAIHYEPLGLYAGKTKAVADLPDGAQIAVPNDTSNEARALLLLEAQGLIKLKEGAGLSATVKDIAENPKNLKVVEIEAAQLGRSLQDVDMAVINGNYAIKAGLKVGTDALAKEERDSDAAETYANIVAVKSGNEASPAVQALLEALKSEQVKTYINDTYEGAVLPVF